MHLPAYIVSDDICRKVIILSNTTPVELAHDLRMPLQLIFSSARMLSMALDDPSLDGRAYARMLMASVREAQRMLDAAVERGATAAPRPRNVDLVACVRGLCASCRAYADERGVKLRFQSGAASLVTALDEDALSRVVLNLIANALRFTPVGGEIRVTLAALGDAAEVTVSDTGAGIPAERQPWVFLRGETDGGHGCGLPIARQLARRMGGDLTLRSAPGSGSAFTLRLPVRSAEAV